MLYTHITIYTRSKAISFYSFVLLGAATDTVRALKPDSRFVEPQLFLLYVRSLLFMLGIRCGRSVFVLWSIGAAASSACCSAALVGRGCPRTLLHTSAQRRRCRHCLLLRGDRTAICLPPPALCRCRRRYVESKDIGGIDQPRPVDRRSAGRRAPLPRGNDGRRASRQGGNHDTGSRR